MSIQCNAKSKSTGERCKQPAVDGSSKCRYHGGLTPRGVASPHFKHGRRSKYLPNRLMEHYQEALDDPRLLELRDDIALIDARLAELITRVSADQDVGPARWKALQAAFYDYEEAIIAKDGDKAQAAWRVMEALITKAVTDYNLWGTIQETIQQRRRLVESERQRLVQMQQMVTAEQAVAAMTALVAAVRANVRDGAILQNIQVEYERLTRLNNQPGN